MDPHEQFCHNPDCPNRGQGGRGNSAFIAASAITLAPSLPWLQQVEDLTVLEEADSSSG
jgi:hypothetical protein